MNIGRDNFDEMRYEYFRDSTVALEAFKGDVLDWRPRTRAKNWATAYDFPAVKDKRVVLEEFPNRARAADAGASCSTRGATSSRIRGCGSRLNYAFDFEEMNKQLFFGQYQRINSYFEGHRACVVGLAGGQGARNPRNRARQGAGRRSSPSRSRIRSAARRRTCARTCARRRGCCRRPATRSATRSSPTPRPARPFSIEFLTSDPNSERFVLFYKPVARAARHHGERALRSTKRNSSIASATGISTA